MKPLLSAYDGSLVPLYHEGALPPHGCNCMCGQGCSAHCLKTQFKRVAYSNNDSWLGGYFVGNVDVHIDLCRIAATKVFDLNQRCTEP